MRRRKKIFECVWLNEERGRIFSFIKLYNNMAPRVYIYLTLYTELYNNIHTYMMYTSYILD